MTAGRTLQAEIEKVLTKVDEDIEEFKTVWGDGYSMVHSNTPMTANERNDRWNKFEGGLKTQIKELQRDHEQIKIWLSDEGIRDKNALAGARKKIEVDMERCKGSERDVRKGSRYVMPMLCFF